MPSGRQEVSCWNENVRIQPESVVCHGGHLPEPCTTVFALFICLFKSFMYLDNMNTVANRHHLINRSMNYQQASFSVPSTLHIFEKVFDKACETFAGMVASNIANGCMGNISTSVFTLGLFPAMHDAGPLPILLPNTIMFWLGRPSFSLTIL